MRKFTYLLVFSLLSNFFLLDQVLADVAMAQPFFSDAKKSIIVKKSSPKFAIILPSNPTTGFMWILRDYDGSLITPVSRKYHAPRTKLIGAGGYEKWTFRVNANAFNVPLVTGITLIYARSWNMDGAEVSRFKVVTINDD
jgi:inhibitor of cysteine peptidase